MAFWDDDYDLGFDSGLDSSWLDEYDGGAYTPDTSNWTLKDWAPRPEPNFNLNWQPPAPGPVPYAPPQVDPEQYMPLTRYDDGTAPDPRAYAGPVEERNPVTGTISRMARGAGNWIADNPKDALGMVTGAGLGAAGLFMQEGKVPRPDMGPLNAARAALEAQAAKTSRINDPLYEESVAAMRGQIARPQGRDPRLEQERAQQRAELWAKMIPGDIRNRAIADFDRQTTSLLERDAAERGTMMMNQFKTGADTGNPQQTTNIFSRLADAGIQGANLQQQGATTNAQMQEQRRNSMLTAGGNIFGRSITTNPFQEGDYDPKTGKKRTSAFG
jgi:hypothetical protein